MGNSHTLNIYFVGDLLLDRGVRKQIQKTNAEALFKNVRHVFSEADAVVANLECPVTEEHAPVNKRYIFRADPEYLGAVRRSGITHLVMANNHSYDQGRAGIKATNRHLTDNGLVSVGYGVNQECACAPVVVEKEGIKVAMFSSVLLPLENWPYLPDSAGICQATTDELVARIKKFRRTNKFHKIIVILHWGAEFQETPLPEQRQQAANLIDAGADAIVGHHPHVIQQSWIYKGKPVFFSIGNFVFDQAYPAANKGLIVKLSFSNKEDKFSSQPFEIRNCVPYPL